MTRIEKTPLNRLDIAALTTEAKQREFFREFPELSNRPLNENMLIFLLWERKMNGAKLGQEYVDALNVEIYKLFPQTFPPAVSEEEAQRRDTRNT